MKRIYLVQFEEYSDAFTAFEDYGNAYEFAAAYAESMPGKHRAPADMIREVFLLDHEPSMREAVRDVMEENYMSRADKADDVYDLLESELREGGFID